MVSRDGSRHWFHWKKIVLSLAFLVLILLGIQWMMPEKLSEVQSYVPEGWNVVWWDEVQLDSAESRPYLVMCLSNSLKTPSDTFVNQIYLYQMTDHSHQLVWKSEQFEGYFVKCVFADSNNNGFMNLNLVYDSMERVFITRQLRSYDWKDGKMTKEYPASHLDDELIGFHQSYFTDYDGDGNIEIVIAELTDQIWAAEEDKFFWLSYLWKDGKIEEKEVLFTAPNEGKEVMIDSQLDQIMIRLAEQYSSRPIAAIYSLDEGHYLIELLVPLREKHLSRYLYVQCDHSNGRIIYPLQPQMNDLDFESSTIGDCTNDGKTEYVFSYISGHWFDQSKYYYIIDFRATEEKVLTPVDDQFISEVYINLDSSLRDIVNWDQDGIVNIVSDMPGNGTVQTWVWDAARDQIVRGPVTSLD